MRKICLRVKDRDIERAIKLHKKALSSEPASWEYSRALFCPVALVLHRFKGLEKARVTGEEVVVGGGRGPVRLPNAVSKWIQDFDLWTDHPHQFPRPQPFEIEIEVPSNG